jgi:hypothetical protein
MGIDPMNSIIQLAHDLTIMERKLQKNKMESNFVCLGL